MEPEIAVIDQEQQNLVFKLEKALNILKYKPIKNVDSLENIKKPVDDLLSSLKYLPTEPSFSILPTEIKTRIMGYLCNSGAFAAATVCLEWKEIIQRRVNELDKMRIGNHCSNKFECDRKCCIPEAMLKAVTLLKLDIPLTICHPLTHVDIQLVVEALTSVSELSIIGNCTACVGDNYYDIEPILTNDQKEQLLLGLENRSNAMDMVEFRMLDLTNLDQDRLINCLVNKNVCLELEQRDYGPSVDIRKLVGKLKDSTNTALLHLRMHYVRYPDDLAEDMADALCQVPSVTLFEEFRFEIGTTERLLENILNRPIRMKILSISRYIDWNHLISPDNLKTVLNKMMGVDLVGIFTLEQLEAARSCPGVQVINSRQIIKWL